MRTCRYSSFIATVLFSLSTLMVIHLAYARIAKAQARITYQSGHSATAIPFDSDFGLIFVRTTVNESDTLWFVLDTGFDVSLINAERVPALGLEISERQTIAQPGGEIEIGTVSEVELGLQGLEIAGQRLQAVPLTQLQPIVGRAFDGLLGHDVLERFVVVIDYERKQLGFYDPRTYEYSGSGQSVPVSIEGAEPFVEGAILRSNGEKVVGKFKIDTGSIDALGLNRNFLEDNRLLEPSQETLPVPGIAVGGETSGLLFRVPGFWLGRFLIRDPVIGATLESQGFERRPDAGTIGGEILSRFTVILDYQRQRIILEPNGRYEAPPASDMSGMWLVAEAPDFTTIKVRFVTEGSPAADAGIQAGDVLVAVDGQTSASIGLARLWQVFRASEGREHRLSLLRGTQELEVTITLRPLL
ncbi:MAG: aspartyl protease family protein [Gemmatimonadota bacterium]|nr:MAG: aspartyl protease family protein [Gemmatimonadota bacterium]